MSIVEDEAPSAAIEDTGPKKEKSPAWWASPIRNLIAETQTLPGKVNVGTVAILAGMWIFSLFALLAEMAFQIKVNASWISFEMGGSPLSAGIASIILLTIWLGVTLFCIKSYLEATHSNNANGAK